MFVTIYVICLALFVIGTLVWSTFAWRKMKRMQRRNEQLLRDLECTTLRLLIEALASKKEKGKE